MDSSDRWSAIQDTIGGFILWPVGAFLIFLLLRSC